MTRTLLLLALGVVVGYTWGYKDARAHDRPVVERIVDRAGGPLREKYVTDVDGKAARLEER